MNKYLEKMSNCPLCGSSELEPAFLAHYWRENPLEYSDCGGCGATFANPMPSDELISQGNDALTRLDLKGRTPEQEFREARQAYLRGKMLGRRLTRWKKRGRLLELGSHRGFFALGVKESSDWEAEGLEISSEMGSFAAGVLGLKCHVGTLEALDIPAGRYDFVVCHDLIEHINRPRKFLASLSALLGPGGRVQIITPNARQDLAFTRRSYAAGIPVTIVLNHILYFRTGTLRRALESVGLNPVQLYCYDVRYALKDFGVLGLGKPRPGASSASMHDALALEERQMHAFWTPERLQELREHRKTSAAYGFIKETLPRALTLRVPASLEIGHEIYALAEKRG